MSGRGTIHCSPTEVPAQFEHQLWNGYCSTINLCLWKGWIFFTLIWYFFITLKLHWMRTINYKLSPSIWSIKRAISHILHFIIFEGDSKGVIGALQDLHSARPPMWFIAPLLLELKAALNSVLLEILFYSERCKFFAHNYAHWAASCNWDGSMTISSLPSWVFSLEDWDGLELFTVYIFSIYHHHHHHDS